MIAETIDYWWPIQRGPDSPTFGSVTSPPTVSKQPKSPSYMLWVPHLPGCFQKHLVILAQCHTEDDGCDGFKTVNPLFPLRPLATYIKHTWDKRLACYFSRFLPFSSRCVPLTGCSIGPWWTLFPLYQSFSGEPSEHLEQWVYSLACQYVELHKKSYKKENVGWDGRPGGKGGMVIWPFFLCEYIFFTLTKERNP